MSSFFTPEFFAGNRLRLLEAAQSDCIVIGANGLLQRGGDTTFPFQQDANFWYLTGINEPDITLVICKNECYLIVPPRSDSRQAFDGSVSLSALSKRSGIAEVLEGEAGWQKLQKILQKDTQVGVVAPPPGYLDVLGLYTNPARERLKKQLLDQNQSLKFEDITPLLRTHRSVKQAPELAAIQKAIDITSESLKDAAKIARESAFQTEYELEAAIAQGFRARGARGHAFEPIVAAGQQACTLHYVENSHRIKRNELIVLDVGAEVEQYAADITRTITQGTMTERQQAVFDAVLDVQRYALGLLKPGVLMKEYEHFVQGYMAEKLQALSLINDNEAASVRKYYPHASSHFLGLNVHDVGNYDQPLEADMVITVEPGIYIPEEGIGVRIEDDVLITKTGTKVLSAKLPSKL